MNIEECIEYLKLKIKNDNLTIQGMFGDIYEEIQNDNTAIETLLTAYEYEKETSHYNQSQLDIANAKLVEEKEKNKELEDTLKQTQNSWYEDTKVIKKQSKEIEHQIEKRANQRQELATLNAKQIEFNKLVNTVNSYKGQFKKQQKEIEELKENNKTLKNLQNDTNRLYIEMTERKNYFERELQKVEDKIKAKIEEQDETKQYWTDEVKDILKSLLRKE